MRVALVTDAWHPQINGVVRTLSTVVDELTQLGHDVVTITPDRFRSLPCPGEPEIRLALATPGQVGRRLADARPEAIHIATEGPLGQAARRYCRSRGLAFTSSYHTHFPQYLEMRMGVPRRLTFAVMRRFHAAAARVLVTTDTLADELAAHGITHTVLWPRGVDARAFAPRTDAVAIDGPRPVMVYVGRVAVEKNIGAFLDLDVPGTKVVVGDGPQLAELKQRYPDVVFAGWQSGDDLARWYAAGDVFVFASRTDTYGLVLLEALASGLPVAAYPVPGPADVLGHAPHVACLNDDLATAVHGALELSPADARAFALDYSWTACATRFVEQVEVLDPAVWDGAHASLAARLSAPVTRFIGR
ncbi:glycosyltransferase family 4 protein [Salinisphaera hydrothermalis]|uniref:Glycosyltransferase n=1 Tax=Salinisphaera hydrothermalis (strain C41B8) TaxID=1304275 RepID=A0A084IM27_SALHC|nr:glycosyltransferase family 1 protein [Salinisphaera hydrothermalis]KEZ77761.1 glycosyltransferase [Salinisphaera hydrothermalis C41B8]